jgi:hypothetical protein
VRNGNDILLPSVVYSLSYEANIKPGVQNGHY